MPAGCVEATGLLALDVTASHSPGFSPMTAVSAMVLPTKTAPDIVLEALTMMTAVSAAVAPLALRPTASKIAPESAGATRPWTTATLVCQTLQHSMGTWTATTSAEVSLSRTPAASASTQTS